MNDSSVIKNVTSFSKKMIYNMKYGRKFKKLNIDKSFSGTIIERSNGTNEKAILHIISKSKNKEEFEENIRDYLKTIERNVYASILLLGNVTGKYVFNNFYYDSLKELNIDSFSKENQELLLELKSHFYEYVMENNRCKNTFVEKIKVGETSKIKDLSQDINKESLLEDFEKVLNGEETDDIHYKPKIVTEYLMKTIGVYSKEDIKSNFDFILYDINNNKTHNLDERRKKYLSHSNLSNNQLRKIDEVGVLKQRLQNIREKKSEQLLLRLCRIENNLDENIRELEDIYSDYEVLYRQDLINNLYIPNKDIEIIDNYKNLRPQLIHQFIRETEKFRAMEIEKTKEKIISERINGNDSKELTDEEKERLKNMTNQIEANLNQYKVNYTTDGKGMTYSDKMGLETYQSDTTNQISAALFKGDEFINSSYVGIIGIGFNEETLTPEAIAISSNNDKTTNRGINNIEDNENNEFRELSAPFSELIKTRGKSEIVMHRRGIDFDTKASYIFATINSSNSEQTEKIMKQIEETRKKEGLKVVIYDINEIKKSLEQNKQEIYEEK